MFTLEEIVVVDEIDLHASRLDGCYLDDQRVISVVDDQIHSREADNLMQLVASLVDVAEFRHKRSDLATSFLNALRQVSADCSYL